MDADIVRVLAALSWRRTRRRPNCRGGGGAHEAVDVFGRGRQGQGGTLVSPQSVARFLAIRAGNASLLASLTWLVAITSDFAGTALVAGFGDAPLGWLHLCLYRPRRGLRSSRGEASRVPLQLWRLRLFAGLTRVTFV
jgi:hypothetical protein